MERGRTGEKKNQTLFGEHGALFLKGRIKTQSADR